MTVWLASTYTPEIDPYRCMRTKPPAAPTWSRHVLKLAVPRLGRATGESRCWDTPNNKAYTLVGRIESVRRCVSHCASIRAVTPGLIRGCTPTAPNKPV